MNLLRRKLSVTKIPKHFTNREVFYIVWHKGDESEYFLTDAQNDGADLYWSVFQDQGIKFEEGKQALAFCNEVKEKRKGPGIIELKVVTEKVEDDDDFWAI